ncbi:hypothetical protein ES706_03738 [subsurface metagenome]
MKIIVDCVRCGREFDILEAKWCGHYYNRGDGTKVCPHCGACACDQKDNLVEVRLDPPIRGIGVLYLKREELEG